MQSVSKFSGARGNPDERRIASEGKEEDGQVNGGRPLQSDRITNKNTPPSRKWLFLFLNPLFAVAGHSFIHSLGDALMLPYGANSDRVKMRCYCVCAQTAEGSTAADSV